jgi:protoporphyrinogen oxidase
MNPKTNHPVLIVGAGVTGLSLGALLAARGITSIVVEKEDTVGGLARSFRYEDFVFDIGPHRFHTDRNDVDQFVRSTLGPSTREIDRNSQVHFMGHYYPWPLRPKELLFNFPPRIAVQVMWDLMTLYRRSDPRSFRDHIENMYGKTLYKHFFEAYSSKFLGITPELTDVDWATTGVDRAIIDKRLKMNSLWQLVWNTFIPGNVPSVKFVYPEGGCGIFTDNLANMIKEDGGEVLTNATVEDITTDGNRISSVVVNGKTITPSIVVWTGTIHSLGNLLMMAPIDLDYLALVCYNITLTAGEHFNFQWCYHGSPDVYFSRVSIPDNFNHSNTPAGKRSFCVEVPCSENDTVYNEPKRFLDRVLDDLKRVELLKTSREVLDVHTETFPWAYPIYKLGYRRDLNAYEDQLKRFDNLYTAGRLGRFWYNNMDHCIEESLRLAEELDGILRDQRSD